MENTELRWYFASYQTRRPIVSRFRVTRAGNGWICPGVADVHSRPVKFPMATQLPGNVWGQPIALNRDRTNPFNNDVSTRDTIKVMRKLARAYAHDPLVAAAVAQALAGGMRSQREIASALFYWVRSNIKFIEDETLMYEQLGVAPEHIDKELLIIPPVLLSMPTPMGDCDDFSLLLASMLLCVGIQPFFVTVAAEPEDERKFSHIYVCACLRDERSYMCLDAGNRFEMVPPGWEPSNVTRKAIWAV